MTLVRHNDWQWRLAAYIDEVRTRSFIWGQHDCALFAAGAIAAMTGHDLAAGWRRKYCSSRGAARVLRREGYRDVAALAAAFLSPVPPLSADIGDVAIIADPDGRPALGIVIGAHIAGAGADGLKFEPRSALRQAFHLPFAGEVT